MEDQAATKADIKNLEQAMLAGFRDLREFMEFMFAKHERKLLEHDTRFDRLDSKFANLETRIEDIEGRRKRR